MRVEVPTEQTMAGALWACLVGYAACPLGPFQKERAMGGRGDLIELGILPRYGQNVPSPLLPVFGIRESGRSLLYYIKIISPIVIQWPYLQSLLPGSPPVAQSKQWRLGGWGCDVRIPNKLVTLSMRRNSPIPPPTRRYALETACMFFVRNELFCFISSVNR